jgi:hypothetical protein
MQPQWTKLEAAGNDVKKLMVEVSRVMEKAQEAVERITCKTAASTTESGSPSARERAASLTPPAGR